MKAGQILGTAEIDSLSADLSVDAMQGSEAATAMLFPSFVPVTHPRLSGVKSSEDFFKRIRKV